MPRISRENGRLCAAILALGLGLSACAGTEDPSALDEPVVVPFGDFKKGKLPGTSSKKGSPEQPFITSAALATNRLRPGIQNVPFSGRATDGAYSVGVRLLDQGSGYWVRTVLAPDTFSPDEREWNLTFNVGILAEPGKQALGVVAFDKDGRPGSITRVDVCVESDLPDNGNVCDPKVEPPKALASLRWNTDADLDLIVLAPDGTRYSRSEFSQVVDGKVVARLDADGTAGCDLDGRRMETFEWLTKPKKGTWYIYANLFDACEHPAVSFALTTYRSKKHKDGTFSLVEEKSVGGTFLRAQATPDTATPLYLAKISFP